jgi:hypothetical protein
VSLWDRTRLLISWQRLWAEGRRSHNSRQTQARCVALRAKPEDGFKILMRCGAKNDALQRLGRDERRV